MCEDVDLCSDHLAGDGRQTRSVCYVDDTIEGVLRVARSDISGPVNDGNDDEMSVLSFFDAEIAA